MKKAYVVTGIISVLSALGTQACTLGSDTYITAEPGSASTEPGADGGAKDGSAALQNGSAPTQSPTCTGSGAAYAKVDLSKLTACEGGKGHCFDKTKTPMADQLKPCANAAEVCVPDEVLEAAGKPLKSCTSIVGPGGCITSSLIPEMEKRAAGALKPDVCDADQVCAPCNDPTNGGAATPFCQPIGVFDGAACSGGTTTPSTADAGPPAAQPLPACCTTNGKSNGVCISETGLSEEQREQAPDDTCSSGNKCVPKAFVEGKPVTCNSGLLGRGVCMDTCFDEMMGFASMFGILGRDLCGSSEVCIPCTFVSGQGVPGCQ